MSKHTNPADQVVVSATSADGPISTSQAQERIEAHARSMQAAMPSPAGTPLLVLDFETAERSLQA